MGRRKQKYQKKAFESTGISSDTSANIYMSMMLSPAWKDLTANQQRLYLYCKAQYYGEKKKPDNNLEAFTMNQSKWADLYGLYKKSNAKGFYKDMSALILHGFITCQNNGSKERKKNVYKFSSMWQNYGKQEFCVKLSDMTVAASCRWLKEEV